jgi:hypothetical protein
MANYQKLLLDPRWQKKRLQILERDEWTCRMCGCTEYTLHIHHEKYANEPWNVDDNFLKTVCKYCHTILEISKDNNDTVFHIEKARRIKSIKFNVFVKNRDAELCVLFYDFTDDIPTMFFGVTKEAVNRFNNILNSF